MPAAVVRAGTVDEIDELTRTYEWLFEPPGSRPARWDPARAAAALQRVIASDDAIVLVATIDGQLAGLCTAYDDIESVRFGRRVWVEDLAVHPSHRSLGVGRQLLEEAKRWARSRGATRLQLESGEARLDAHRFYEQEGADSRSISFGWEL